VIPAYNCAAYIGAALASVRAQTAPPDEIVVIDDGSTDGTAAAVGASGADVRYVHQSNAGPSAARNRGTELASGDLVAFLDADDEWHPRALERFREVVEAVPDLGLVSADMAAIDGAGRITAESWLARNGLQAFFARLDCRPVPAAVARLAHTNFVSTSLVLAPRRVLLEAGGFPADIRYGEDLDLWLRIAARHPVVCLPEVLGRRRVHGGNATRSIEPMLRDLVRVTERLREWGREVLAAQGESADRLVADAWARLGYWYFSQGRTSEARAAFRRSLREKATWRAMRYSVLSTLPTRAVDALRSLR
jgi:glycosyltransferase involved in cell wall biosynthesis